MDTKLYKQIDQTSPARRVLVTATPIQNGLNELSSLLHLVSKRTFANLADFFVKYQDPIEKALSENADEALKQEGEKQMAALTTLSKDYIVRRTSEQVGKSFDQPINEFIIWCKLTQKQKQLYTKKNCSIDEADIDQVDIDQAEIDEEDIEQEDIQSIGLKAFSHLQLVCNSAQLVNVKQLAEQPLNLAESSKLKLVDAMLRKIHHHNKQMNPEDKMDKVVIVSNYKTMLSLCEKLCRQNGYSYFRLDGATPLHKRSKMVDKFREDKTFIFMISSRAGGVGINLSEANHLIMLDSHWNPQNDIQAMARITRLPQKKECYIYR